MASKNPQILPANASDHDLWVLPPAAHSKWFARIDWYLNWQMSKGTAFVRQRPSLELFRVMDMAGMQFQGVPEISGAPLMVASSGRVASERCVVVDLKTDTHEWLIAVHKLCGELQSRRTRVFLPAGMSISDAESEWKKLATSNVKADAETDFPIDEQIEFSTDEEKTL